MTDYQKVIQSGVALFLVLFACLASSMAAEFTLAWDPYEDTNSNLIGYNLYYKANSSVQADLNESTMIYIPLEESDFDPDYPSYLVTGLQDDTEYYFTVTAMVGDDESGMSNEVSAINGAISHGSTQFSSGSASDGSASGGCFINTMK